MVQVVQIVQVERSEIAYRRSGEFKEFELNLAESQNEEGERR